MMYHRVRKGSHPREILARSNLMTILGSRVRQIKHKKNSSEGKVPILKDNL